MTAVTAVTASTSDGAASLFPDCPRDPDGQIIDPEVIRFHSARGGAGICVAPRCGESCYDWWDLSAAGLAPVVDRRGTLTDQVPVHPRCAPVLVAHWASIAGEAPGGGDAPDPAPGGQPRPDDDVEWRAGPRARGARQRVGRYAAAG